MSREHPTGTKESGQQALKIRSFCWWEVSFSRGTVLVLGLAGKVHSSNPVPSDSPGVSEGSWRRGYLSSLFHCHRHSWGFSRGSSAWVQLSTVFLEHIRVTASPQEEHPLGLGLHKRQIHNSSLLGTPTFLQMKRGARLI